MPAQRRGHEAPWLSAQLGGDDLHVPWAIPVSLVEGIFLEAYPARRFQSAWMGIIVHSVQSVFVTLVVLALVMQ